MDNIRAKVDEFYTAIKAEMKNNGENVSDKNMLPVKIAFEVGVEVLVGFFSLVESAHVIAEAKRVEMGWRPGK